MAKKSSHTIWQIDVMADAAMADALLNHCQALDDIVSLTHMVPKNNRIACQIICDQEPSLPHWHARLAVLALACGCDVPAITSRTIATEEWQNFLQYTYPPITLGRLHIAGDEQSWQRLPRHHRLWVKATTAFGTGEHPTTASCLTLMQAIPMHHRGGPMLDLGCGTGILALAAARLGWQNIWAADNDLEAVHVARAHCRHNQIFPPPRVVQSLGMQNALLRRRRYTLIVANLFARPLCLLGAVLPRYVARGGYVVLSGIMAHQANGVMSAWRGRGLKLLKKICASNWVSLLYCKP
ncbi:MAG: hypothetical protein EBZ69_02680 [Alphaproteobacteria bacterium]|nr:hypothetical protein [Alphaproteobacteria bacterium]